MISPTVSAVLNILVTFIGAVAGLGAEFTTVFGEGAAHEIVSIASIAVVVLGALNTALHSVSSPAPGPLVK